MTITLTDHPIHYRNGTFLYDSDVEQGPDFYFITCPDGHVSGPHCVSTSSSLSVVELLHMDGHGHKPDNPCDTCDGTGYQRPVG